MEHPRYVGKVDGNGKTRVNVLFENAPGCRLPLRLDLWNHSPTGFNWGYGGSGPAQLALAILAFHFNNNKDFAEETCVAKKIKYPNYYNTVGDGLAVLLHQQFKFAVIAHLDQGKDWVLTTRQIRDWCLEKPAKVENAS